MTWSTRQLDQNDDVAYDALVRADDSGLIYASSKWRRFLQRLRPDFIPAYMGLFERARLVGALPGMIAPGPRGNVFNSLPFYGSNGGVVVARDVDPEPVAGRLFEALTALAAARGLAASTVISNPLQPYADIYLRHAGATATDDRIGQITCLPICQAGAEHDALMEIFHSKTRNMVRKGLASGLTFVTDTSPDALAALHEIHTENMAAIGGLAKPWSVFAALRDVFRAGDDYQIYVARDGPAIISAVLVLYFNRTAEYFTPVTRASHRSAQPLSALILHAMADAIRRGMRWWNWGGTWATQDGVYLFKSRWGTRDLPYRYYVREYEPELPLRDATRSELLAGYPYTYVVPFGVLRS